MDIVTRRKPAHKDTSYAVVETDVAYAHSASLWKTWPFWVLLCCVFTVSGVLCGHWMSSGSIMKSRFTINQFHELRKLPAISSENLEIHRPDPIRSIVVQDAVVLPTDVLLLVKVSKSLDLEPNFDNLECHFGNSAAGAGFGNESVTPVISMKPRTREIVMVRCQLPAVEGFPLRFNSNVTVGIRDSDVRVRTIANYHPVRLPTWNSLVYENLVEESSFLLLAKGLSSKSSRRIDNSSVKCVFGNNLPMTISYETAVIHAAQEVVRCKKPPVEMQEELRGLRVSVKASWLSAALPSVTYYNPDNSPKAFVSSFLTRQFASRNNLGRSSGEVVTKLPSIEAPARKRKLCACTMVWNKADFIREWVMFHSYMGVEKYFVYDNDSDDDTEAVLDSLAGHNISMMVWPWIKTQQAAFSHCTILARDECEWMMFTDVDEYIYPYQYLLRSPKEGLSDAGVLHRLIGSEVQKANPKFGALGQIQFECHNFGPSGLKSTPKQGVTVGYNCRTKLPQRHKSIVKLDAINYSLLNVLHHFELREGFYSTKLSRRVAVVNHYKYQAWDAFKMKFVRRAGTYTTDWQRSEAIGSKDRTPGLGTEAKRPSDWESQFCEIHDTGLRDFSLRTFALPDQPNLLQWQRLSQDATSEMEAMPATIR